MSAVYWRQGSRWRDYFVLLDNSGSPLTGEAGNCTVSIMDADGDVATTGVTVTETDSVDNPGVYEVEANPLTSFVGTIGQYVITVTNSTTGNIYKSILYVTSTTIPSMYIDGAIFTASASDGRVTDGTDPLEGVLVTLLNSSNVVVYQTETDSSGVWSSILEDGTYTISLSISGYARATGTLTMTGGSGSVGSDLEMTIVSVGTLTASTLFSYTRRQMADHQGSRANAIIEESVNAALRVVSRDFQTHPWWESDGTLTLRAEYTTGTVAITSGTTTLTLSGGTWPAWAASAEIYIEGTWYFVSSRDSDTQLTLSDAYPGSDLTASSFELAQVEYDMPSDLQQMGSLVFFENQWPYGAEPSSYEAVQRMKHLRHSHGDRIWAGHNNNIAIWPPVETDTVARFLYMRAPAALDYDSPTALVDIDPLLIDVVQAQIDCQLLRRGLYTGGDNPRESYKDAKEAAYSSASKRATARPPIRGRRRVVEPRMSYNQVR